ncbi:unnamed protein product [Adineta steineri]|uniref:NHL repeat containing protein n=2 Tax=Adineta steineri TaxID=433720 RepID=A0A819S4P1_9BILA|nr:unnamed protein product [Adineta steineri]
MEMENNETQYFEVHLPEYEQIINDELDDIINSYDRFKQTINEQKENPQNNLLIEQINQWETNSIEIIQKKAKDCRDIVIKSSQTFINDIENKFNDLNEKIKEIHQESELNETNLNYLKNQLIEMTEELNNPPNISIQKDTQSFINEISVISSKKPKFNKWKQTAITAAGGNRRGQKLNLVNYPFGIFIDKKKNVFIADSHNHRVVEWKCNAKEGQIIAGGNGKGNQLDQLNRPTDVIYDQQNDSTIIADYGNRRVIQNQQILINNIDCWGLAMDKQGFLYVSNWRKNEVRRWKIGEYDNEGIVVAGGNAKGYQFSQLNFPTFIFVDEEQSVYVSDYNNDRVVKWRKDAKEGRIVAGGNGQGENLNQLFAPEGVIVDDLGRIYVADCENHRIMRWFEGKEEGEIVVGGNGIENELNGPMGLSFDDEGNLYVADCDNYQIKKFEIIL